MLLCCSNKSVTSAAKAPVWPAQPPSVFEVVPAISIAACDPPYVATHAWRPDCTCTKVNTKAPTQNPWAPRLSSSGKLAGCAAAACFDAHTLCVAHRACSTTSKSQLPYQSLVASSRLTIALQVPSHQQASSRLSRALHSHGLTTDEAMAGPPLLLTDEEKEDMPSGPRLVTTVFWSPDAEPAAMPPPLGSTSIMPMEGPGPAAMTVLPSRPMRGPKRAIGGMLPGPTWSAACVQGAGAGGLQEARCEYEKCMSAGASAVSH